MGLLKKNKILQDPRRTKALKQNSRMQLFSAAPFCSAARHLFCRAKIVNREFAFYRTPNASFLVFRRVFEHTRVHFTGSFALFRMENCARSCSEVFRIRLAELFRSCGGAL